MPGVTKKVKGRSIRRHGKHPGGRLAALPPCSHQRNEKDRVGECEKCGGPTPYFLKCYLCFCEWCEV